MGKFFLDKGLTGFRRRTAVILPKDIGIIIGITALSKDHTVVEIGGGSGYASYYLARIVKHLYVYERKEEMYKDLLHNLKIFENVDVILDDGRKADKNAYLYLIDSPDFIDILRATYNYIERWAVIYLPNANQAKEGYMELKRLGFRAYMLRSILEEWEVDENILKPKHKQLYHTAFLVAGERIG